MKKLIIAAAIVCVAAMSQAASCTWNTYAYDSTMTTPLEGGSYWIVSLGTSSDGLADLVVKQDGTVDFGSYSYTKGDIPSGTFGAVGGDITGLTTADNGSYYAIVVADADFNYYGKAAGAISGITDTQPAAPISFDNSGLGYGATLANTATEAVPEPTSGLLLLLGVAGLALRRRRA